MTSIGLNKCGACWYFMSNKKVLADLMIHKILINLTFIQLSKPKEDLNSEFKLYENKRT